MPPRRKIIDAHTHVVPAKAELAVEIMDAVGIDAVVVCEWFNGFGDSLDEHLATFAKFPGRFIVFGNIDFTRIDEPDFGDSAAAELRRGVAAGMRGLKVFKLLGMGHKDASGERLGVDDERLDPVWAAAGELGVPVLIHTADPQWFWEPIDEANPWENILREDPAGSLYGKGGPTRQELLGERNALVRRHPGTNFIAPHLASYEDQFVMLAEALESMPNLYVDIAARLWHMAHTPRRRDVSRQLCIEFADRMLFGSDLILLNRTEATDVQSQTFLRPEDLPERFADAGERMLVDTTLWFYEFHRLFLETDQVQSPIPFRTRDPDACVHGLDLPPDVLDRMRYANIERLVGATGGE